jgi:hypothetical protein
MLQQVSEEQIIVYSRASIEWASVRQEGELTGLTMNHSGTAEPMRRLLTDCNGLPLHRMAYTESTQDSSLFETLLERDLGVRLGHGRSSRPHEDRRNDPVIDKSDRRGDPQSWTSFRVEAIECRGSGRADGGFGSLICQGPDGDV